MNLIPLLSCLAVFSIDEAQLEIILKRNNGNNQIAENLHRIVGGTPSFLGEFPWQGLFFTNQSKNPNSFYPTCGCSLLDDQWVVTAAHCTEGRDSYSILIAFNLYNTNDYTKAHIYSISEIKDHPSYIASTFQDDISLLKCSVKIFLWPNVQPIALPTQGVSETVGKNCIISGWGDTSYSGTSSRILLKATVPVIDNTQCLAWYYPFYFVTSTQLCAGYEAGGVDTCQGDSGGPLACPDTSGTYILQGITSTGIRCASPKRPGIYTRVSEYVTWINNIRNLTTEVSSTAIFSTEVSSTQRFTTETTGVTEITATTKVKAATTDSITTKPTVTMETSTVRTTESVLTETKTFKTTATIKETSTDSTTAKSTVTMETTRARTTATTKDVSTESNTQKFTDTTDTKTSTETISTQKDTNKNKTTPNMNFTESDRLTSRTKPVSFKSSTPLTVMLENNTGKMNATSSSSSIRYSFSAILLAVAIVAYILEKLI